MFLQLIISLKHMLHAPRWLRAISVTVQQPPYSPRSLRATIVRPMAVIPACALLVWATLSGAPALADDDLRQARPGDPVIPHSLAWLLRDRDPVLACATRNAPTVCS